MTQRQVVLNHLKYKGNLTAFESFRLYGITQLGARIFELKRKGHEIGTIPCVSPESGKHFVAYYLIREMK